jgi:hypothetical protein
MIIATVTTCPQRWEHYQRLRRNFQTLKLGFILRTFQTTECPQNAFANNNLNARAALAFSDRHLPETPESWLLYLEDDVVLNPALATLLPKLIEIGKRDFVDCWYLCNRKNPTSEQHNMEGMVMNRLAYPMEGSHGLLLPKRHLRRVLDAHWGETADRSMFSAIRHDDTKILQVIKPVLVEHVGEVSTFNPSIKMKLEINHAN